MGNFKVGDVCVIVKTLLNHEFRGTECTIISVGKIFYECQTANETLTRFAFGFQLRLRRKPPSKDEFTAGEWELCPWSPYRVGEHS